MKRGRKLEPRPSGWLAIRQRMLLLWAEVELGSRRAVHRGSGVTRNRIRRAWNREVCLSDHELSAIASASVGIRSGRDLILQRQAGETL